MTEPEPNDTLVKVEPEESESSELAEAAKMTTNRRSGKRGRKPAKIDVKAKLERSRQSARECRARKKLRYQYLEELVSSRERAVYSLRRELESCKQWCLSLDKGKIPPELEKKLQIENKHGVFEKGDITIPRNTKWCVIASDSSDSSDSGDSDEGPSELHPTNTTETKQLKGTTSVNISVKKLDKKDPKVTSVTKLQSQLPVKTTATCTSVTKLQSQLPVKATATCTSVTKLQSQLPVKTAATCTSVTKLQSQLMATPLPKATPETVTDSILPKELSSVTGTKIKSVLVETLAANQAVTLPPCSADNPRNKAKKDTGNIKFILADSIKDIGDPHPNRTAALHSLRKTEPMMVSLEDFTMATSSPFAMDTPAIDTAVRLEKSPAVMDTNIAGTSKQTDQQATARANAGEFSTINTEDILRLTLPTGDNLQSIDESTFNTLSDTDLKILLDLVQNPPKS